MSENNIYIVYLDDIPQFYTKTEKDAQNEAKKLIEEIRNENLTSNPIFIEKISENEYRLYTQYIFFFMKYDTLSQVVRVESLSERKS